MMVFHNLIIYWKYIPWLSLYVNIYAKCGGKIIFWNTLKNEFSSILWCIRGTVGQDKIPLIRGYVIEFDRWLGR